MQTKIVQWAEIVGDFSSSLVLGNGASIAVSPVFAYPSLLEEARKGGLLSQGLEEVFRRLATSDFELVLLVLWHAQMVNQALRVPSEEATEAHQALQAALIETVRSHHASYQDVSGSLARLHAFLRPFSSVVSLNYDLLVYWCMRSGNEVYGNWFKDCFISGVFEENWARLRSSYQAAGSTLVFYPHGNLILAASVDGQEQKLSVAGDSADLLETVFAAWGAGELRPVFVAEGSSPQKLAAINRSVYLRRVYSEVLTSLGPSVAIYGWSLAENDEHILRQILKQAQRLAVSIHRGVRTDSEIDAECFAIRSRVARLGSTAQLVFYWSEGETLWNHVA